MGEKRETFEIPAGFEAVLDAEGRATGEVRPVFGEQDAEGLRERIQLMRDSGLSLMEAKRILIKEALLWELDRANDLDAIKRIIRHLITGS